MEAADSIDGMMRRFRFASRELFNQHFWMEDPSVKQAWEMVERFSVLERALFTSLVVMPAELPEAEYGTPVAGIQVELEERMDSAPALLNREVDSEFWDHPVHRIVKGTQLTFIRFFDSSEISQRDNQFVLARVDAYPGNDDVLGKEALIEARYVRFVRKG